MYCCCFLICANLFKGLYGKKVKRESDIQFSAGNADIVYRYRDVSNETIRKWIT